MLVLLTCGKSIYAKPSKFLDGIEIGVSEKGANLNFINNISSKNQLIFGVHKFKGHISKFGYSLIEPVPILYSSKGIKFYLKRFITGTSKDSSLFAKFGLGFSSLEAKSNIDLSKQIYDLGSLTLTCRTCGTSIVKTSNSSYRVIPSILLGWQQKVNEKFGFSIGAGLQYIKMPSVIFVPSRDDNLPPYVQKKIDSIINNANKDFEKIGNIIPSISINANFYF